MKIWTSEHTFSHPWDTVVKAAWRKYPNPMNTSVVGVDVVDRSVDPSGVLKSHRLMSTSWGLPHWAIQILGTSESCYASEHSEVDPSSKTMTLRSRNVTFCNIISIDENLKYTQHPTDKSSTLLSQEAVVNVRGIPLSSYMEGIITNTISNNANKGRQAMEWVIGKIGSEAREFQKEAQLCMDNVLQQSKSRTKTNSL